MPEYDDSPPTHRYVMVGYALTEDRQLDRERIQNPHPELLPADEAKRLVKNGHGRYATDEEIAAVEQGQRGEQSGRKAEPRGESASPADHPADVPAPAPKGVKRTGWGAKPDSDTTTTSTKSGE